MFQEHCATPRAVSERISTTSSARLCPGRSCIACYAQQERRKDDTLDDLDLLPPRIRGISLPQSRSRLTLRILAERNAPFYAREISDLRSGFRLSSPFYHHPATISSPHEKDFSH